MQSISYIYNKRKKSELSEVEEKGTMKKSKKEDDVKKTNNQFNTEGDDNRIYFRGNVTEEKIEKLIEIINKKNKKIADYKKDLLVQDVIPKPIYLHITSYGGDLLAAFRAIDAIQRSKIPIYTVVDGHAASAATLMSIVGKRRYMTPNSYMLIHQLSSGVIGKFWELKDDFENCETLMNDIYNLYVKYSKMNLEELKKYLSHDKWWKVDIALERGLIDEIYVEDDLHSSFPSYL